MARFHFTGKEIRDILISVAVLSFVFAYPQVFSQPSYILLSLVSVGMAFAGHEISHKFTAIRYGFPSQYKMWPQGLLMALFFAIISGGRIIFAAPGAVTFGRFWLVERPAQDKIGKIGISGALFNIIAALTASFLYLAFQLSFLRFVGIINAWLALFNLIPFSPLDGSKVFSWDKKAWGMAMGAAILSFIFLYIF